ncbi:MAG: hypothetical protein DRP01_02140 [Archaeoglobales archaeon]|nr:MAG: hypothetical protein DRP01_02140 [Archaeoglobales archaeon]
MYAVHEHSRLFIDTPRLTFQDASYVLGGMETNKKSRICTKCGKKKASSEFLRRKRTHKVTGVPYTTYSRLCKGCLSLAAMRYVDTQCITSKVCRTCGEEKPLIEFNVNLNVKDGKNGRCKSCRVVKRVVHVFVQRKTCTRCGAEKDRSEFIQDAQKKDGLRGECVVCCRKSQKKYHQLRGKVAPPPQGVKVCATCGTTKQVTEFYLSSTSTDGLVYDCKPCNSSRNAQSYQRNSERRKTAVKVYMSKGGTRTLVNARVRKKRAEDPQYKIACNLRSRMAKYVSGERKPASAVRDLGCTIPQLLSFLESLFYDHPVTGEVMSWGNYGKDGWSVDHWIPVSSFDLEDGDQYKAAAHWGNLRPLWESTNAGKGATPPSDLPSHICEQIPANFWEEQKLPEAV